MLFFALRVGLELARGSFSSPLKAGPAVAVMRVWPMDADIFMHLNNAMFARLAELARWRCLSQSGMLAVSLRSKWQFLVAEQTVTYRRQLPLFRKFQIETSVASEGKWFYYTHNFLSLDRKTEFATMKVRAVLKLPTGKTVQPKDAVQGNTWFRDQLKASSTHEK